MQKNQTSKQDTDSSQHEAWTSRNTKWNWIKQYKQQIKQTMHNIEAGQRIKNTKSQNILFP